MELQVGASGAPHGATSTSLAIDMNILQYSFIELTHAVVRHFALSFYLARPVTGLLGQQVSVGSCV